jgi:hypothetical protein
MGECFVVAAAAGAAVAAGTVVVVGESNCSFVIVGFVERS